MADAVQDGTDARPIKEHEMSKINRSAITGRFVSRATAARRPKTTVTQTVPSNGKGNRSAISGRFVTDATVARHRKTSIREGR
ncbi:MAG TPA: hypothetical protein VNL94_01670 [Candidatus Binatia bacterium]|nr:hypothetical protein [Candidatus Binatia bacterium]